MRRSWQTTMLCRSQDASWEGKIWKNRPSWKMKEAGAWVLVMMDGKQITEASEGEEASEARGEVTTKLVKVGAKMSIACRNS